MFAYARLNGIFEALRAAEHVPASALARQYGVTERTVRSDIAKLNDALASHGARIEVVRSQGYHLVVESQPAFEELLQQAGAGQGLAARTSAAQPVAPTELPIESPTHPTDTARSRQRLMLHTLLEAPGYVSNAQLMTTVYVGETALRDYARRIRELLGAYDLELVSDPARGLAVRGREVDRRRCFTACVLERNMGAYLAGFTSEEAYYFRGLDLPLLKRTLRAHLEHFELAPDDFAEKNALMHLALAVQRARGGHAVEAVAEPVEMPLSAELFIAETCDDVERLFAVELGPAERDQLYLHFVSNAILPGAGRGGAAGEQALRDAIGLLLDDIRASYGFDLRADEALKASLTDHLRFAFSSRELGVSRTNPLVNTIRTSYPLAFEIALSSASRVFTDPAHALSEDEVGYIALHVGAAIERSAPRRDGRVRAVLVCGAGRSMAGMLEERLGALFGDRLEVVRCLGYRAFQAVAPEEWTAAGVRLAIATQALPESPLPAVVVDYGLGPRDMEAVSRALNALAAPGPRAEALAPFFSPELFLRITGTVAKDELLELMCARLAEAGVAGPGFLDAVLERERLAATDISSALAIPHALFAGIERTRVAVALLKHPVRWNEQAPRVQIVLLLAFRPGDQLDFERLFDLMLEIANDSELQRRIMAAQSYEEFVAALA